MLPGDRHLVHWVSCLETDPEVKMFELMPKQDGVTDPFCAVDVVLSDGSRVRHQISNSALPENSQLATAQQNDLAVRIFSDQDLQPFVKMSMRWLKPIGFAATLRNQPHTQQTLMLLEYFKQREYGEVGDILTEYCVSEYDRPLILGLTVRLAIKGHIRLDLGTRTFGYKTPWTIWVKEH